MLRKSLLALLFLAACQPSSPQDFGSPSVKSQNIEESGIQEYPGLYSELPSGTIPPAPRNPLPLTGANFCAGVQNAMKTSKQNMAEEIALICNGNAPTPLLASLWSAPFEGVGVPTPVNIRVVPIDEETSEILLAYSMRLPKKSVQTLLGEEKHAVVPYDSGNNAEDPMKMSFKFLDPPANTGDCDTGFLVEQFVQVPGRFDDTTQHELKLYLMHPNNFDFFMAGRTLVAPSTQFKRSVVFRGFLTDPADASKTISTTILHFVMNSREQHERMVAAFMEFIRADMLALFNEQKS